MINDFLPSQRRQERRDATVGQEQTPFNRDIGHDDTEHVTTNDYGESPTLDTSNLNNKPPQKKRFHLTKKQWIIVGVVVGVLAIGGLGWAAWQATRPTKSGTTVSKTKKVPKPVVPTTVASTLTGRQVMPAINELPVTGVMIENSPDARPQSGLEHAGVVFEAVAEGGITRFLTLFQDTSPDYIGPVRSVRPYYLDWLRGFDGAIAHVGGSPAALAKIKAEGIKDLDQFANGGSYTRISSRYAPHNVYTSIANMQGIASRKGYGAAKYTGFERKADAPSKQITARLINFNISGQLYNPHFDYDPVANNFIRSQAGAAHMETDKAGAQVQIRPNVIIALIMPKGVEADDLHTSYGTIGSGAMFVFQDGIVTQGTWNKASSAAQFSFTDAAGKPLKLNVGQTWITILGTPSAVTYQP